MSREEYDTQHYLYGVTFHTSKDGMDAHVRVGGRIVKRFKGERAWFDAKRHAYDLRLEAKYGPKPPR